jgi:hypothetical protein
MCSRKWKVFANWKGENEVEILEEDPENEVQEDGASFDEAKFFKAHNLFSSDFTVSA